VYDDGWLNLIKKMIPMVALSPLNVVTVSRLLSLLIRLLVEQPCMVFDVLMIAISLIFSLPLPIQDPLDLIIMID